MFILIAGGRDFNDYNKLLNFMRQVFEKENLYEVANDEGIIIVSGKAQGADALGEVFANRNGFGLMEFPADWKTYGKAAGFIRNAQMVDIADLVVCFWDGQSHGTKHTIGLAQEHQKKLYICSY